MSDPFAQPSTPPSSPQSTNQGPPFPHQRPYPYPAEPVRPTSGFAISSLIFGIIGGVLLSVIFGIIALRRIRKRGQKGRRMAIAGLVLSGIWVSLFGLAIVKSIMNSAERGEAGEIVEEGTVSTRSLEIGDCLTNLEEADAIASVSGVPCTQPHDAEVFGRFDLPTGEYPDEASMNEEASAGCSDLLREYSPEAFNDPSVGLFYLFPTELAWPDDREIVCIALALDGPITGSYLGREV